MHRLVLKNRLSEEDVVGLLVGALHYASCTLPRALHKERESAKRNDNSTVGGWPTRDRLPYPSDRFYRGAAAFAWSQALGDASVLGALDVVLAPRTAWATSTFACSI